MSNPQDKKAQPPINEQQVQALLGSLQSQRNAALNALAQTEASLALASARVQELEKQVAELKSVKQDVDLSEPA